MTLVTIQSRLTSFHPILLRSISLLSCSLILWSLQFLFASFRLSQRFGWLLRSGTWHRVAMQLDVRRLKLRPLRFLETWDASHPVRRCDIPEERRPEFSLNWFSFCILFLFKAFDACLYNSCFCFVLDIVVTKMKMNGRAPTGLSTCWWWCWPVSSCWRLSPCRCSGRSIIVEASNGLKIRNSSSTCILCSWLLASLLSVASVSDILHRP